MRRSLRLRKRQAQYSKYQHLPAMPGPSAMCFHSFTLAIAQLYIMCALVEVTLLSEQLILGPNVCSTLSSSLLFTLAAILTAVARRFLGILCPLPWIRTPCLSQESICSCHSSPATAAATPPENENIPTIVIATNSCGKQNTCHLLLKGIQAFGMCNL